MKVLLSHAGKQHAYHLAKALLELGVLEKFYTSSYVTSATIQHMLNKMGDRFWSRRFLDGLSGNKVEANWRFEIKEMILGKFYGQGLKTLNAVYDRDEKFDRFMARRMSRLQGDIFWGFQGSSLNSLRAAKANGKFTICELAAAHAPAAIKIFKEEKELYPEWADSFSNFYFPPDYYSRLCSEPHEADIVVGASSFSLHTLRESGVSERKLRLLPLGFDLLSSPPESLSPKSNRQLKILFAGRITQGKGVKYLLDAVKDFNRQEVELHLIGHVHGSGKALAKYKDFFTLHAPLPQVDLCKAYSNYDVLVLPSLFEGFGLVIIEAMAYGLPVITTANTMGPDIIHNGINGYIVPIRSSDAIREAIERLLTMNPDERARMRKLAKESALNYTWSSHQLHVKTLLTTL